MYYTGTCSSAYTYIHVIACKLQASHGADMLQLRTRKERKGDANTSLYVKIEPGRFLRLFPQALLSQPGGVGLVSLA